MARVGLVVRDDRRYAGAGTQPRRQAGPQSVLGPPGLEGEPAPSRSGHAGVLLDHESRAAWDRCGVDTTREPPARAAIPAWMRPTRFELRDLSCLAIRQVADLKAREPAGMIAVVGWLRGLSRGPVTGRTDSAQVRDVALCELCAAECRLDDGRQPPPLHEVSQLLEVAYWPPEDVDAEFALGVWLTLSWALGETERPPLNLPIRSADGTVAGEVEIYAQLVTGGQDRAEARETATALAAASRRLAALVEDTAARIRA